ncbi:MAG: hypothetical protein QOG59_593, partial [Solirubrobacteraceae bacterium]|nr:hypothetical protein [Solirubrobacteraceae bacterium]
WTAQNLIAPRLGARRPVPGAPKRFAQAVGTVFSSAALVLALLAGAHTAASLLLVLLAIAAGLESLGGLCLGCMMFAWLMRAGVVPESVCLECADISARLRASGH